MAASLDDLLRASEAHASAVQRREASPVSPTLSDKAPPRALVLVTTVYTCECGQQYRSPNPHVLVRYDAKGYENSVHYRRRDLGLFAALDREHKLLHQSVPYCEACFGSAPAQSPKGEL